MIRDIHSDRVVQCPDVIYPLGVAWSPNGRLLAVAGGGEPSDNGTQQWAGWVHIFDTESGARRHKLSIGTDLVRRNASAVAWSHDGRKFAVANERGLCEVFEAETGRKLVGAQIHSSQVNDLAWSLDDRRVASGGIDEQVHLWDSATGQQLLALEPCGAPIRHIRWSPDGHKLAAVGDNGAIRVWDASGGYELPQRDLWRHLIEPREQKKLALLIGEQRWTEAAGHLKDMIAGGNQDPDLLLQLAQVSLQLDDQAGYRNACKQMLSVFADTEGAREALSTAMACTLRPGTLKDYGQAIALARRARDLKFNPQVPGDSRSDYPEALGAILYRAGKYPEALLLLQTANEVPADRKRSSARIAYLLAMTHHRLGHAADARMWLDRANADSTKELSKSAQPTWGQRLTLEHFHNEASDLIRSTTAVNP